MKYAADEEMKYQKKRSSSTQNCRGKWWEEVVLDVYGGGAGQDSG